MPNELLDQVCAYVACSNTGEDAQDATSLASCCRVSRRFYAAAQPLLYSSIRLELMTGEPNLLLKALKANVHLAGAVRTLFIQCGAPCSTPMQHINQLRDFLAQALPLFTNLTKFRSDHRITTVKLVETTLVSLLEQFGVVSALRRDELSRTSTRKDHISKSRMSLFILHTLTSHLWACSIMTVVIRWAYQKTWKISKPWSSSLPITSTSTITFFVCPA